MRLCQHITFAYRPIGTNDYVTVRLHYVNYCPDVFDVHYVIIPKNMDSRYVLEL